ncbi:hypothetical protein SLEP1_g13494 [Rubroshorea leprosula]|uniref:Uncharacterized protein n=1 Tax=Rubroshorea leprosula TaxID=152421 RepID=A0AAV5IQ69_9ROSI|nr:hypothetical protein SLEP1_g13494 [Rubroshorea leprosula]
MNQNYIRATGRKYFFLGMDSKKQRISIFNNLIVFLIQLILRHTVSIFGSWNCKC